MKELIRHLLDNNMDAITKRSLLNCHCFGLHSIMLLESPGQTIRLYVAERGNTLYKNSPYFYEEGMSIGFHPHHCNLTLHCVKGRIWNWALVKPILPDKLDRAIVLKKYRYQSQITGTGQGFKLLDAESKMLHGDYNEVREGRSISMSARSLHTVATDPFEIAAWLVYEGREDDSYDPLCYSTSELEKVSSEGLYLPATRDDVRRLIDLSGLMA